jgi:hypothetical protein
MSKRRTAIDANLLIAAWSARAQLFATTLAILEDPDRILIVSDALEQPRAVLALMIPVGDSGPPRSTL